MAVTVTSQKGSERAEIVTKRHNKLHYKTRPITATLEHPLILDIKLLKKLDMTTFTKKGLVALSKFCGISLVNKTYAKKKLSKCVKTIQCSKKQRETDREDPHPNQIADSNKREFRAKRKLVKQMSKAKPRIRFKMAKEDSSPDEDALDVVCKNHGQVLKSLGRMTNSRTDDKLTEKKTILVSHPADSVENIIPEPCKTCNRSEHPERFHSHPKALTRLELHEKSNGRKMEDQIRQAANAKDATGDKKEEPKKSPCAKESEDKSLQGSLLCDEKKTQNSSRCSIKSPAKSSSSTSSLPETPDKSKPNSLRSPFTSSQSSTKSREDAVKKSVKPVASQGEEKISADDAVKFVTGCYVCGKQLSPKSRMKHEKSCIVEWRARNVLLSADMRKPEPKRPDFRFTASGDLDCEGSFQSIWANHMDSLVPCKKCGRTFFPDRIERHENCCNNAPVSVKYRH